MILNDVYIKEEMRCFNININNNYCYRFNMIFIWLYKIRVGSLYIIDLINNYNWFITDILLIGQS